MNNLFLSYHSNNERFYTYGSSKDLLFYLFSFIDKNIENISKLYLCLYLYNNGLLHNKMKALAERGISVNVISIPLEGYDKENPKTIFDPNTNYVYSANETKYSLAKKVYDDVIKFDNSYYSLYLFDHIYVRSKKIKKFSRGNLPYSLHTKSIFIEMKDGSSVTGLTSSNLAVRDESKDEVMILMDDTSESQETSRLFFHTLINNSTPVSSWQNINLNSNFVFKMNEIIPSNPINNYYTAPFFKDSPVTISKHIIEIVQEAKQRIYICAQHLAAYNYNDTKGEKQPGIFGAIFERCREGIPVKCLSQTYVDANDNSHYQRTPSTPANFKNLISEVDKLPLCKYAANKKVHAKFIVVDDIAIISTGNYTPTEFLYGHIYIDNFELPSLKGVIYDGIFSEVSHFIIINDHNIAENLIEFFDSIYNHKDTFIHNSIVVQNSTSTDKEERIYIACPYEQRNEAKSLGAKWDPIQKKWYYLSSNDASLFEKWKK